MLRLATVDAWAAVRRSGHGPLRAVFTPTGELDALPAKLARRVAARLGAHHVDRKRLEDPCPAHVRRAEAGADGRSRTLDGPLRAVCYDRGMAATDVLTEILRLPAEQRAKLALELIRSLNDGRDADAAAAWDDEIERRAAEVEAGTAETITLDEYRAHVRARRAARAPR
jgi:putative addiction module component (TIGR02574 family)